MSPAGAITSLALARQAATSTISNANSHLPRSHRRETHRWVPARIFRSPVHGVETVRHFRGDRRTLGAEHRGVLTSVLQRVIERGRCGGMRGNAIWMGECQGDSLRRGVAVFVGLSRVLVMEPARLKRYAIVCSRAEC